MDKKWKASSSTSPSNRYLDHYKYLLTSYDTMPNSPTKSFFDTMWHIFTSLANFAIHTTQHLERWKTTIVIMPKKSPKIIRWRVIGRRL